MQSCPPLAGRDAARVTAPVRSRALIQGHGCCVTTDSYTAALEGLPAAPPPEHPQQLYHGDRLNYFKPVSRSLSFITILGTSRPTWEHRVRDGVLFPMGRRCVSAAVETGRNIHKAGKASFCGNREHSQFCACYGVSVCWAVETPRRNEEHIQEVWHSLTLN